LKWLAHIRFLLPLIIALFIGQQSRAQNFGVSVTVSTNLVIGTNTVTYGLTFTNLSGSELLNVRITNDFSASVTLVNATNSQGSNAIVGSDFVFFPGRMQNGQIENVSLTIQPVFAGLLTNTITLINLGNTNMFSTNIVTLAAEAQADLGITIVPPIQAIITNDFVTYNLVVTNATTNSVSNVTVTHQILTNVIYRSVSQSFNTVSNSFVFNIGTLPGNSSVDLRFDITPTNVGSLNLSASVTALGLIDTFPTNNVFITNVPVLAYLPATLVAVTNSSQKLNIQNGLTEQSVLLSNTGTNDVPAMRLVVTGLATTNHLFNAVGTNNSNPFVYYSGSLAAGAQATLLLQYAPRSSTAYTNIQLHLYAVPLPDWTAPRAVTNSSTTNIISKIVILSNHNPLIEFPATAGNAYIIVYAKDATFSDARIAPPGIISPANKMQWIDYGPPTTVPMPASTPSNAAARFYRVLQSP